MPCNEFRKCILKSKSKTYKYLTSCIEQKFKKMYVKYIEIIGNKILHYNYFLFIHFPYILPPPYGLPRTTV